MADLQALMEEGEVTACRLVKMYVERIEALDRGWPAQRSTTSRRELPEAPGTASNGTDGRGAGGRFDPCTLVGANQINDVPGPGW